MFFISHTQILYQFRNHLSFIIIIIKYEYTKYRLFVQKKKNCQNILTHLNKKIYMNEHIHEIHTFKLYLFLIFISHMAMMIFLSLYFSL